MSCLKRPKLWGIFPRGHEWDQVTRVEFVQTEKFAANPRAGFRCIACGEKALLHPQAAPGALMTSYRWSSSVEITLEEAWARLERATA